MKKIEHLKFRLFLIICISVLVLIIINPARHAKHYLYVPINDILPQLIQIPNINTKLHLCSYDEILLYNRDINFKDTFKYEYDSPLKGISFVFKILLKRFF